MTRVERAESPEQIAAVQRLWRVYQDGLDESLERQGFEAELRSLPGVYARPLGALLLAVDQGGAALGTAALRPLDEPDACELKRMVVLPASRGRGVGRLLLEAIIQAARERYGVIRLDTSSRWAAANALYRSAGFVECDRYNDDPDPDVLFMERAIR